MTPPEIFDLIASLLRLASTATGLVHDVVTALKSGKDVPLVDALPTRSLTLLEVELSQARAAIKFGGPPADA